MAKKAPQTYDVWIIETKRVYKGVPYNVVTDWAQQGRLLADDRLRPTGTEEWVRAEDQPAISPFLLRSEPHRAEDQAEALEPVHADFTYHSRHDEEDDDPDMIPLIDVSLVLLIFFLMTSTGAFLASSIPTPPAVYGKVGSLGENVLWVGIDMDKNGDPIYSLGEGEKPAQKDDDNLITQQDLLVRLDAHLQTRGPQPTEVIVRANENLPSGVVRRLQVELERRGQIVRKFQAVSEKKAP